MEYRSRGLDGLGGVGECRVCRKEIGWRKGIALCIVRVVLSCFVLGPRVGWMDGWMVSVGAEEDDDGWMDGKHDDLWLGVVWYIRTHVQRRARQHGCMHGMIWTLTPTDGRGGGMTLEVEGKGEGMAGFRCG